jgi:hypothetical protein
MVKKLNQLSLNDEATLVSMSPCFTYYTGEIDNYINKTGKIICFRSTKNIEIKFNRNSCWCIPISFVHIKGDDLPIKLENIKVNKILSIKKEIYNLNLIEYIQNYLLHKTFGYDFMDNINKIYNLTDKNVQVCDDNDGFETILTDKKNTCIFVKIIFESKKAYLPINCLYDITPNYKSKKLIKDLNNEWL